jgi:UMF1 family MFS transporter
VCCYALLAQVGPGEVALGMLLLVLSAFMFHTGEDLIAGFLPEIAEARDMGRVSGYGWSLGYLGGMLVLGLCLVYVMAAQVRGEGAAQYVPVTMLITAVAFALAALPTFLWLRERAVSRPLPSVAGAVHAGFARVRTTLTHAHHYRDLFRFLITLSVYYCGIYTVIVLAAVYAQQVMGFSTQDTIVMILVVNATAALGAFGFGRLQDRIGSVPTAGAYPWCGSPRWYSLTSARRATASGWWRTWWASRSAPASRPGARSSACSRRRHAAPSSSACGGWPANSPP